MKHVSPIPILRLSAVCLVAAACTGEPLTPPLDVAEPSFARVAAEGPSTDEWVQEVFIDRGDDYNHAGPGPHPTEESNRFSLIQGGVRWFAGDEVKYEISGAEAVGGGNDRIEASLATIDGYVTARAFARDDASPTASPCGGVNRVVWASIDGPGGILAATGVCRNVATKEIAGFTVTMDSDDDWSTSGEADKIDVENVAVHEFGHAAGLDHVNAPRDGCLTMYRFGRAGETQKRTLGLGDKLGMNALYGSADVAVGACGS